MLQTNLFEEDRVCVLSEVTPGTFRKPTPVRGSDSDRPMAREETEMYRSGRRQTSLFGDNWVYKTMLQQLADHPLVRMKPLLDKAIAAAEPGLRTCYSTWTGRPACPVGTLLKLHVLEYLYRLSDAAVTRMCMHDVLFRWFVDLDVADDVPDSTTLVKFRGRLKQEGFQGVLEELAAQAEASGYLQGQLRVLDATHVFSDTPKLRMRGLIRQGMNLVLKAVGKKSREVAEKLRAKYRRVLCYSRGKGEATRAGVRRAVKEFAQDVRGLVDGPSGKVVELIRRVARGNPDRLVSLTDLDARWGHKSRKKVFGGYKVHVVCAENGYVTGLEVLPGNVNEGGRVKELLEPELKRGREIREVYADKLYDNGGNRKYLREKRNKAFIPSRVKGCQIEGFEIEGAGEAERVRCPEGKHAIGRIRQEEGTCTTTRYWTAGVVCECGIVYRRARCARRCFCLIVGGYGTRSGRRSTASGRSWSAASVMGSCILVWRERGTGGLGSWGYRRC